MNRIIECLFWWAFIGFFAAGLLPNPETKKEGLKQMLLLGPFFWVGVCLFGIYYKIKGKA